jgi:methionyl-tRNA formyltransferase
MTRRLILLTPLSGEALERLMCPFRGYGRIEVVATLEDLRRCEPDERTSLISFGSGVIVSAALLGRLKCPAYNVHAASPEFPGRDPHHHAIYRGASSYGATLHVMTAKVDAGPIVAVERFPVPAQATPADLLCLANEAGMRLVERIGARLLATEPLPALDGVTWGSVKTSRADFTKLAHISSPLIGEAEMARRYRAFDGGTYDNLTLELHDHLFRIDKRTPLPRCNGANFAGFTEEGFRSLLHQLKASGYRFARYCDLGDDRHVIWRHDVDFSIHRAVALALIEAEEGVAATYFLNPRCVFYNLLEPEIMALVRRIAGLGHEIGLHFDAGAFAVTRWGEVELIAAVNRERQLLELALNTPVRSMSWHNPDRANLLEFEAEQIGGLANAYAGRYRRDYVYCSDSNGYWRFKPMPEVIAERHHRLHLLTHPVWWTPKPMAPSARIDRAILGRARKVRADYNRILAVGGRKNIG